LNLPVLSYQPLPVTYLKSNVLSRAHCIAPDHSIWIQSALFSCKDSENFGVKIMKYLKEEVLCTYLHNRKTSILALFFVVASLTKSLSLFHFNVFNLNCSASIHPINPTGMDLKQSR
jgi:hypothetical protein